MENLNIRDFIKPELIVLVPVLMCIGVILKRLIKEQHHRDAIPAVLCLISIVLSALYAFSFPVEPLQYNLFIAVTQGILCWGLNWITYKNLKGRNR